MRTLTISGLVILMNLMFLASGCSDQKSGHRSADPASPPPATVEGPQLEAHQPEQCPKINGEYIQEDGRTGKIIETEGIEKGVKLLDTSVTWVVDGERHSAGGQPEIHYVGTCHEKKVALDLYQGDRLLGRMEYSLDSERNLITEIKFSDPRFGSTGAEVWQERTY